MFSISIFTALLPFLFLNCTVANHVRSGDVTEYGEFDSYEGRRAYYVTARIKRPVLCWEDFKADGVILDSCDSKNIMFDGNLDESDFARGIVITFPKEDYVALGCPLPPEIDYLSKVDQVIFREIVKSKLTKKGIQVTTKYISGGMVVPSVELHVGDLVSAAPQLSRSVADLLSLSLVSRTNNIGATLFKQEGSTKLFRNAKADWSYSVTAGVCEFRFDRVKLLVTWEQSISADATASINLRRELKRTKTGTIFQVGIPGAGFSIRIFLVGRISFGLTAGMDYEAEIETGAAAVAKFSASLSAGQKVTVGIRKFETRTLSSDGGRGKVPVRFRFKKPVVRVNAFAKGFIGVRPFIEAGLGLPLIGDADVNAGGTVGINTHVRFNNVPFKPIRTGRRIGVCSRCHSVQGTIDLEGRRLSISGKIPLLERKEKVIQEKFLDFRVGVLCLFRRKCPSAL